MHTAHALRARDFAVRRDGRAEPLDRLWPDYRPEEDRLAVLANEPLDPVGCANLVVATTTLFYEHLRETVGEGSFFRYPDFFVVGVGTTPADFRKLDVWPPHKELGVGADSPEPLLEALTDRRVTLLALPEGGLRCAGPVVRSTWETFAQTLRHVVVYAPPGERVEAPSLSLAGNPTVEGYAEHAIETCELLGAAEREAARAARAALGGEEALRRVGGAEAARDLLGVTEVLAPGVVYQWS